MEKILVVQTAFLGDAILTLPMIQKLFELFKDSKIDVLAIPSTAEIFSASPYINEVIIYDKKKEKSLSYLFLLSNSLKHKKYSRIYSPHRSFRTSLLVMNTNVKETYGFSNSSFKYVYKNVIKYMPGHHEIQRNFDLIGFNYRNDEWKIPPIMKFNQSAKNKVDIFISNLKSNDKFIALAPGSIWNTKIYPLEYFEEVIKYLSMKSYNVILIGSEQESTVCKEIASKYNNVISAAGIFTILESIYLLKKTKLLICNDSAPTHMGLCAEVPVLTLYCSTSPHFGFYPYTNNSFYLSYDNLNCKPCGIHGKIKCPLKTFECGYKLDPGVVISKIEEILND